MKAKQKINISVTGKDIVNGDKLGRFTCPVARAIRRRLPDYDEICVDRRFVILRPSAASGDIRADLPDKVENFIRTFDRGEAVRPIRFALEFWS